MKAQQARGASGGAAGGHSDGESSGADLRRMAQMKRAQQRKKAASHTGDEKSEAAPEKPNPATAMAGAIGLIQNQVLPEWNRATDALDPAAIRVAGSLAIAAWNDVLITSSAEAESPEAPAVDVLKQTAVGLLGELGLRKVGGKPLPVQQSEFPADPLKFIQQQTFRAAMLAERARNIVRICKAAPPDEKGKPGMPDDDAQAQIVDQMMIFIDDDFLWLESIAAREGVLDQLINLQGMAHQWFQLKSDQADQHRDLSNDGKNPMKPEEEERINDAADKIQSLVEDTETADYEELDPYLKILDELTPEERTNLFYILQSRGLIHDMAHLGSDGVLKLIRETPQWHNYVINDACRTHLTRTERLEDAAVETARQFPGAMMGLGKGFVGGLGNLPVVGGAFDYAADKIGEARDWTNKKMGADPHIAKVMGAVEGGIGNAGAVGAEVMVGGEVSEVEGMGAAAEGAKLLEAYEIYKDASVLHRVYSAINGLRTAWDEAPKIWHEAEPIIHQFVHLDLAGLFSGDEAKLDAVDGTLDVAIDELQKLGGEKFTAKGKEDAETEDKERQAAPGERKAAEQQTQDPALVAELKQLEFLQSKANLPDATPEEKDEFKREAQKVEQMMKKQANPELAAGKASLDEDAKKAAAQAAVQKGDPDLKDLGKELYERMKELVIGSLFGALKGFKKAFIEPLKKEAKGGPIAKEKQQSLLDAGIRGAIEGFSEEFWDPAVDELTKLADAGIEAGVKQWLPAAEGITKVGEVHDAIEKLVKWGVDKLGIQEGMAHLLEKSFDVEEPEEAEKEKLEEGESER